jgi:sRNA-binding regulator protein Hfq
MGISSLQPTFSSDGNAQSDRPTQRLRRKSSVTDAVSFSARTPEFETPQRHAELFYLQKQIQSQTPMVVVLEDGERIEGCIEWYDRNSLKVRGRSKTLIFKSAIKYMYKLGDVG